MRHGQPVRQGGRGVKGGKTQGASGTRHCFPVLHLLGSRRCGACNPPPHETAAPHPGFRVPKAGVIAGCYVQEGEIGRDDQVRVLRDHTIIFEGKMASLRRFKEDVKSVKSGYECGIGIESFQDLKEGDVIEGFKTIEVAREE